MTTTISLTMTNDSEMLVNAIKKDYDFNYDYD